MAEPKIVFSAEHGVYVLKIGGVDKYFKTRKQAEDASKRYGTPKTKSKFSKLKNKFKSEILKPITGLFKRLVRPTKKTSQKLPTSKGPPARMPGFTPEQARQIRRQEQQRQRNIRVQQGLAKRLRSLSGTEAERRRIEEAQQEAQRIERQQRELAKRIGHISGVRIPGVSPEEAARLHTQATGWTQWYPMNSTNVDRIRYLESARLCQAVYKKKGDLYQYEGVEPEIFLGWLQTHSPGQYQWYVIRAYGYRYSKLASGQDVSPPRENRFEGEPFAVPQAIEDFQRTRGRSSVDIVPTAVGFAPPPTDAWKQFRRP